MTVELNWKVGFEIELIAPRGTSRSDLADQTAKRVGGSSARFFHPESEYSAVKDRPVFENLTLGFKVDDAQGNWAASFVDDLTLQADCEREAAPQPGWYRIVSDDARFLRLAERHCDPSAALEQVLDPLAQLFGTHAEPHPDGMVRVSDANGASIAIGAPLPGERERPCEIVTAPIERDHHQVLSALLGDAAALGFTIPHESATHIHFDADHLRSAHFLSRFVPLIRAHGAALKSLVGANPNCVRLGDWPAKLDQIVAQSDFLDNSWDEVRALLITSGLTKYCDFNLVNMVNMDESKPTLEIRILPGMMDAQEVLRCAALFEGVLRWAIGVGEDTPEMLTDLLKAMPLQQTVRQYWLQKAQE